MNLTTAATSINTATAVLKVDNDQAECRVADRRVSPAIGQFAIQQISPLAAEIDRLREVNAGLLAALRAIQMRAKAHEDDTDTDRKRYLFHIEQTARAAIVKAQTESAAAQASPSVAAAVYAASALAADHDDKPDGLPDMHISTVEGDLDLAGRPLKPGR